MSTQLLSSQTLSSKALKALVRTVPDFPKPGVQFRDITTLIGDGEGLQSCVLHLADLAKSKDAQKIVGIEARGFIFGAAVAVQLGIGFVPVRKPGKLPIKSIGVEYDLEYGTDRLEVDPEAVSQRERVLIIDDLIATGGTAVASAQLLRRAGATVDNALFVIDLPDLSGADRLREQGVDVTSLMQFEGD